jgi:phosphatidylserine/phosphatidylglycerophosphate/cardiolipin synthase-like enzyme
LFGIFLIFPIFLLLQETFSLPDQGDRLIHSINTHLKNAQYEVYIFTPVIDEYTLIRSLKKAAKKNVKITLITNESIRQDNKKIKIQNQGAYLSLFQNISVYTLPSFHHDQDSSSELKGSLVCIDNKELFVITHGLSTKKLKSDYAFGLHQKTRCNTIFEPLLERCKPY